MSSSWGSILTELIPLGLVIASSPLTIIPAVLVLNSPRPAPAGLAFLLGWLAGLTALASLFLGVSNLVGGVGDHPPSWASWLRVVIGSALVVAGIYRWVRRKHSEHMPGWMTRMSALTPGKAAVTATVLTVVNPKVLFVCAAAGLAIGSDGIDSPQIWGAVAWFVAVAGCTVALPILGFALSRGRLDDALDRLRGWLEHQHATLIAVVLIVIGLLLLHKGIHAL